MRSFKDIYCAGCEKLAMYAREVSLSFLAHRLMYKDFMFRTLMPPIALRRVAASRCEREDRGLTQVQSQYRRQC